MTKGKMQDVCSDLGNLGYISTYTENFNLASISRVYGLPLTQNELMVIEIAKVNGMIKEINQVLKENGYSELTKVDYIDYSTYISKEFCIGINKTYIASNNNFTNAEMIITGMFGFAKSFDLDSDFTNYINLISKVTTIIGNTIRSSKIKHNETFVDVEDIKLNESTIATIKYKGNDVRTVSVKNTIRELDHDFYPFINVELLMDEFYTSKDKLLILHGEPGTGKTKLANIICDRFSRSEKVKAILVPGRYANDSKVWDELEERLDSENRKNETTLVIIDDLDPMYLTRSDIAADNLFFNNVLTMIDGVTENNVKVIITTNKIIKSVDDGPLYRAGRLFDVLHIRGLTKDEANELFKKYNIEYRTEEDMKQAYVMQKINETKQEIKRNYIVGNNQDVTVRHRIGLIH